VLNDFAILNGLTKFKSAFQNWSCNSIWRGNDGITL